MLGSVSIVSLVGPAAACVGCLVLVGSPQVENGHHKYMVTTYLTIMLEVYRRWGWLSL